MSTPRQLHDLPSLRGAGPAIGGRRRVRRGRRLLVLGVLAAVGVAGLRAADTSAAATGGVDTAAATADREVARTARQPAAGPGPAVAPATPTLARVDGLEVRLPSPDVLLVGYHEASRAGALALHPVGHGVSNANTTRITLPTDEDGGVDYHVMSSRGRVLPPTSAVDIVMRDDDPVRAPVDGVVTEVRPYLLYGQHPDSRIEIRPDHAPHLRVVLIHVDDVAVAAGDRLTAGDTVLAASANRFPFASHVDRYLDQRWPHVHLEVKDPSLTEDPDAA